jgi:hypothetical protein
VIEDFDQTRSQGQAVLAKVRRERHSATDDQIMALPGAAEHYNDHFSGAGGEGEMVLVSDEHVLQVAAPTSTLFSHHHHNFDIVWCARLDQINR